MSKPKFIRENGSTKHNHKIWIVECPICKKEYSTLATSVRNGKSTKCRSCGTTKHGQSRSKLAHVLYSMRQRCHYEKHHAYGYYGARGIKVCDEWRNDVSLFIKWALDNGYKDGLSIDRIDNNGNYEPNNCRWVGFDVQNKNKTHLQKNNNSGYRGVSMRKKTKKWRASLMCDGKKYEMSGFKTAQEAAIAYDNIIIKNDLPMKRNFNEDIIF